MDIDSPPPPSQAGIERIIKIHPLAIIGISDHHTRVVSGGSALPPSSPVVGLLFGYYSTNNNNKGKASTIIVDAEEMEYPKLSLNIGGGGGDKQSAGGALFAGNVNNNNNNDNDDEESNQRIRAAILQKIELHQKVFPQHRVVGWYRVVNSATAAKHDHEHDIMNVEGELQQQQGGGSRTMILHNQQPTEEDLIMTQIEMIRYCGNGMMSDDGASADINSPLFVLMDASKADEDMCVKKSTENSDSTTTTTTTALEELESGDELPLTVYKTLAPTITTTSPTTTAAAAAASSSGADNTVVFVNTEFELETFEPERIAVERVFKTQPPPSVASSNSSTCLSPAAVEMVEGRGDTTAAAAASAINRKTGKKSKKEMDMQKQHPHPHQQQQQQSSSKPAFTRGTTELDTQLVTLQSSIRAMNLRVSVLLEYLQKVERHEIPPEDTLLRSIDGLVRQLPFVLAALEERAATSSSPSVVDGRSPLGDLEKEYSNAMLLSYLACTAKTAKAVHVFCEKFRIACESGKSDPRRSLY